MARKLSFDDAQAIRSLYGQGRSVVGLAKEYNVGLSTIYNIVREITHREGAEDNVEWQNPDIAAAARAGRMTAAEADDPLGFLPPETVALMRSAARRVEEEAAEEALPESVLDRLSRDVKKEKGRG